MPARCCRGCRGRGEYLRTHHVDSRPPGSRPAGDAWPGRRPPSRGSGTVRHIVDAGRAALNSGWFAVAPCSGFHHGRLRQPVAALLQCRLGPDDYLALARRRDTPSAARPKPSRATDVGSGTLFTGGSLFTGGADRRFIVMLSVST